MAVFTEQQKEKKVYYGIKCVHAWPQEANRNIGTNKQGDPGYGVMYEDGYVSWSPKEVFEKAYKASGEMSFAAALHAVIEEGKNITRASWRTKEVYIFSRDHNLDTEITTLPYLIIRVLKGEYVPWTPAQTDIFANDWMIVSP